MRNVIIDPHIHHLLRSKNQWYPGLKQTIYDPVIQDYCRDDYLTDAAMYEVRSVVHVSATSEPRAYLRECLWLDRMARQDGWPAASVGAVDPTSTWKVMAKDLDEQLRSPLLRGVRVLRGLDPASTITGRLLRRLCDTRLSFDLVTHPAEMPAHLAMLKPVPDLTVVVEHAGWPLSTDRGHFEQWRSGIGALARRPNTYCKISGLAMTLHTFALEAQRPWIEACLEAFGPERCMVASNFPVDRAFGSFADLYSTYEAVGSQLSVDHQRRLFVGTAQETYRL